MCLFYSWVSIFSSLIPADNGERSSGYVNPILAYGEDKAIQDAAEAGANGFIMVDLPPEEAVTFMEKCRKAKYAEQVLESLSFIYILLQSILRSLNCPVYLSFPCQVPGVHCGHLHLCCLQSTCFQYFGCDDNQTYSLFP